jgi:amino acid adenylation domain-containing protein
MFHTDGKTIANDSVPATVAEQNVVASFPMTSMQMGLIYESVLVDRPWINLEQIVCRLNDEPIDRDALRDAWASLAARHEALRCVFRWQGLDQPMQFVLKNPPIVLNEVDLSTQDPKTQDQTLAEFLKADRDRGVDLTTAPGWHLTWFRLGARKSVLVWTLHHAIMDGGSWKRVLREVFDGYTHGIATADPTTAPLSGASFGSYCTELATLATAQAKAYFQNALAGFDAANHVDLGKRPNAESSRKKLIDVRLPVEFGQALAQKAEDTETTVATLVLAAWGLVVARGSNRADAVIGVVRSGRYMVKDTAQTAGCLINTLPTRVKTAPELTIDGLLKSVRADQITLRPFEHASLADLGTWTEVPAGNALFETSVMFDRGTLHQSLTSLGGIWATRSFEVLEEGALPLSLAVYRDENMLCRLEYDPTLYSRASAQRLLGYLTTLLRQFTALSGTTPLSQVQMLSPGEMGDVLDLAAPVVDPANPFVPLDCLVTTFESIAQRRASETALSQIGLPHLVSYGDLDQRANRLAHLLRAKAIGPGDLVALCLSRSVEYVVSMLAVMKSGAAFVPVDPSYPAASIDHMLSDSAASLILTTRADHPRGARAPLLLLDQCAEISAQPDHAPDRTGFDPDRTAYVIYTSGSTGLPKGVPISHRALCGHITAMNAAFEMTPDDHTLQFASLSFDVSIEEILPSLMVGGELILRDSQITESMGAFLQACKDSDITVLNLPTAFWHILVDHMELTGGGLPASVRLLIVGGEAISPTVLARFTALAPDLRCLNGYGTTEATITSTLYDTRGMKTLGPTEDVPVGRPLAHARTYVLSPDGALAPKGAAGALWLGGMAISAGYLNRPELNATRFCPDPFGAPQGRMYESGDIVRWREDGNLAFAGRSDRQVKVNGFRIELREIEKALEGIETVGLCLAAVPDKGTPQARLAAWVTPAKPDAPPEPETLCTQIAAILPAHMIPALCVVPSFPKTPGGKVDLAALPNPVSAAQPTDTLDQDADPVVKFLCKSFAELLELEHVGPTASFFDMGGHSLLAVRLIGRIEARFEQRLSIAALRNEPTPRALARMLEEGSVTDQNTAIVEIQPKGSRAPIFGVHVLGPNEGFFRPLATALGEDQPLFGLSVGLLTKDSPTSVKDTAALYRVHLQKRYPKGPIALAAVSQGSFIAFELAQQLRHAGRDVVMLALFDAAGPAGRDSLRGRHRIGMHLHLLRCRGLGYLKSAFASRMETLQNTLEKQRVKRRGLGGAGDPSVSQFVAANTLAIEDYKARPYHGPITLFRAQESVFDTAQTIENGLGWRPVAGGEFEMQEVAGGHLSMLQRPYVTGLAQRLAKALDRIR